VSAPERLRAPQEDRAVLALPPLSEVPGLLADNRRLLAAADGEVLGRSLPDLRRAARRGAVSAARDYLAAAGEPLPAFAADSVLMAGHQPELFHPGVWVKNFALNGLARRHGACPINLVVDNDTVKRNLLHVPVLQRGTAPDAPSVYHLESLPFDRRGEEAPYEERPVRDEALFASLPERVAAVGRDWGFAPLLPAFWDEVLRQARRTRLLGERFAAARRTFERAWGCQNLELPVSVLCGTEPFAWFASHLLAHLPRFHALYNDSVRRYRDAHGIRSRNHPVPDLAVAGDWLEAPFWAWRAGQARRGRLMVRRTENALELRAGDEGWPSLPSPAGGGAALVEAWGDLRRRGFKVRSRALTNTLYARVFVADLFMHGIGGGKYDELTDELIQGFYGVAPPGFVVLSATLLLPFGADLARRRDCRPLHRVLRDLEWNPQRHLAASDPGAVELAARKAALIAERPAERRGRRERFRELQRLTRALRPFVAEDTARLSREAGRCEREAATAAVLRRRDYPFCLYPEAALRPFCARFLGGPDAPAKPL
jgi:hypothetical protein